MKFSDFHVLVWYLLDFTLEPDPQQADWAERAGTLGTARPAADAGQSEQGSSGSAQRNEEEAGRVRLQGVLDVVREKWLAERKDVTWRWCKWKRHDGAHSPP